MKTVTVEKFCDLIISGAVLQNEPLLAWGQPGAGKSAAAKKAVKRMHTPKWKFWKKGAALIDIRLSQYDSVDLRGIPTADGGFTTWNVPVTLPFVGNPRFNPDPEHVNLLVLDELTQAQDPTLAVAYQLVNDRAVGEHVLMDNVRIVAMTNRDGDKGVTRKLPQPLANRFTHVEVVVDVDTFCVYAQEVGLHPMGAAFVQFRKELLNTFIVNNPKTNEPQVTLDKAYATPRSWEKALRYYADPDMSHEDKTILMAGAIGNGPAGEFWAYEQAYAQLSQLMPAIAKDPKKAPVPDAMDVRYAVSMAISGSMTKDNAGKYHTYLRRMSPEFVMLAWTVAIKRDENVRKSDAYVDFCDEFHYVQ